ncbi:MAG: hypothetical protein P4L50_07625 [Anaerolineaceae bacterium]|nr:hypothetical protein [Anaerolineaceae bacterium]
MNLKIPPPSSPDPKFIAPPVNGTCPSDYNYTQCFYSGGLIQHHYNEEVNDSEFNKLLIAIYLDLKNRAPVGGYDFGTRQAYDTPFWDGYGNLGGNVCFSGKCYKRSEVNYVAQGMWVSASGQSLFEGEVGVAAWKSCSVLGLCSRPLSANYFPPIPSGGTIYWFNTGYNLFKVLQSSYPSS